MPREPQVEALFPTPLFIYEVDGYQDLNPILIEEANAMRVASEGLKRSNKNGWHSEDDLFSRPEPGMRKLCGHIVDALSEVVDAVLRADIKQKFEIGLACDGWINISPRGAYNSPHYHSAVVWSGTYYVQVPTPDGGERSPAGAIEFLDPRTNANASNKVGLFQQKRTLRPKPGALIIFPSYLSHWVLPNESDIERITIAFNANLTQEKRKTVEPANDGGPDARAER